MNTGKVLIKSHESSIHKEIEIKDKRTSSHFEYKNNFHEEVQHHVNCAIQQNGIIKCNSSVYDYVNENIQTRTQLSLIEHYYQLFGQAKGILKYRIKFGKNSFNRYKNLQYETLDILRDKGLFKIGRKIFWATKGIARLELIHAINRLSKGIETPTIMEAGCGSGLNIYLLNQLNTNLDISGFEYTNARLASAIVNLWGSKASEKLFLADICNLNIEDNSIDVIYTNHVLEQLGQEKAEKALKEIWRVCRKGLVICEPSIQGANIYEKWRMKTLGYCEDLLSVAEKLPNANILTYKEDDIRYYPNTSFHLIIEKLQ